jgi:exopolysaccharide biosynthesis polyprenyl glycosylphosphotransferase
LLPYPLAATDRGEFWSALLADHALILASWITVAFAELAANSNLQTLNPTAEVLSNLLRSRRIGFALLFAVVTTLFAFSEGLYGQECRLAGKQRTVLMKSIGWSMVLLAASTMLAGFPLPKPGWLLLGGCLTFASLLGWRNWQASVVHKSAHFTERSRNVLIVGAGPLGRQVEEHLCGHPELGRIPRGFLDDQHNGPEILGSTADLAVVARVHFIDEVIVANPHARETTQIVIREARRNHLDVRIVPELFGSDAHEPWIENLGTVPLVTLHREEIPMARLMMKRILDVVISGLLLLLASPLLILVGSMIKLDSPGPIFYAALRVGRKGKRFRCFKFRTMVADANERKEELRRQNQRRGPCFKIVDDPRITRIGRWLRCYSLDELPQLWNVLTGDMSLVGPRPHPLDDFERYELDHMRRLDVTPGITGLWQVSARQCPSFHTNLALDLEYIEHWSLWMDLRILMKTVAVVLQGTGA